tara:strand:- start:185 stop:1579 length:1395 start_codon:yes stop_codon:yes gene_type:complete
MADGLLNKASIILTPTGYKAGTLYNVAPVVEPYEDFDFARASVASRVNSSGLVEIVGRTLSSELITDGGFPNLDNWSVNGGDYATIVDGALNSNNTENGNWYAENISQNISFVNGKTYKVTFKAKNISGGLNLRLTQSANIIFTQNITSTFVDYVVYYTANADNGSIRIFCNDDVGEFQIDNISVKEIIDTNNIPRISYDSNGDNGHILLEPTTTNLYLNTDTLSTQNVSTSASDYSVSFYGTGTISFSGSYSGSLVGTGVNDRVSLTFTATSGTLTSTVSGSVTNAQIENLGYSTSYMPSLSTQGVRASETANGAGSADLINSTEGVLYAEIAALANDGTNRTIALNKDTNDRIQMYFNTSTNGLSIFYKAQSGATSFIMNETLTDVTLFNKICFKWKANDFALWVNGVETDTVSSGVTPTANTLNALEFEMFNDSSPFYGKCKALAVFNEALSDDELTQLTT